MIAQLIQGFSHRSYLVIVGSDSHSVNQTLRLCWANQPQRGVFNWCLLGIINSLHDQGGTRLDQTVDEVSYQRLPSGMDVIISN